MNEELKIIISAVTDGAKKNIQGVKKELQGMEKTGSKSGSGLGKAFKVVGIAAGAAVAAIGAVTTALVALGNSSKQLQQEQAKLNTAFLSVGSTVEQAAKSYSDLYRFLGDSSKATEAAGHLAKLTTNEQSLAEWTTALQGVYATFGDSLPIEGLTEAANETAKVGTVTGTLADALNWAGVNEDAFNAQLATTNSEAEREALIRGTLNSLYSDAAAIYEKNNAELIAANEAQARLDATSASVGKTIQPLLTAFTNLSNTLLSALAPAIQVVSNAMAWLINALNKGIQYITAFFGILGGKSKSAEAFSGTAASISDATAGIGKATTGAGALSGGLGDAAKQAEKLKKATAGFDELNVMSSNSSSTGASGSGASGGIGSGLGGGIGGDLGGFALDTSGVTDALDNTSVKVDAFVEKIKSALEKLKVVFAPTIEGFKNVGIQIGNAITESLPNFQAGLDGFKMGFGNILNYLGAEFIPNFVNSWSTNILPILGDVTAFGISELGKHFEWLGGLFNSIVNDVILPVLQTFQTITDDIMQGVSDAWNRTGGELLSNLSEAFDGIRNTISTFYNEFVKPVIDELMKWINKVWDESLKPLWDSLVDAFLDISNNILILWNKVLKPVIDWVLSKIYPPIKQTIDSILAVLSTAISFISNAIQSVIKVIKGIIQFITGVFTGDWRKAWDGIKNIVSGMWQAMWNSIRTIINLIIDGINGLWGGIYQAVKGIIDTIGSIANLIGKALGQDWGFSMPDKPPKIPKLAKGGIVNSATLAVVGERGKEAVLPLENNTEWIDKLVDKLSAKQNTPTKIVLMLDSKELGWANINSINGITAQTGKLQLNLY